MENVLITQLTGTKIAGDTNLVSQTVVLNCGIAIYRNSKLVLQEAQTSREIVIFHHDRDENAITTDIQYLRLEEKLWFGTETAFYIYDLLKRDLSIINISNPYTFASWSPGEDALIVVGKDLSVSTMVYDSVAESFGTIAKCHLDDDSKSPQVVGWGSEDTQYQGPLTQRKSRDSGDETTVLEFGMPVSKTLVTITWHSSGEFYAVNYYDKKTHRRTFKVLNYPAEVCSVSDNTIGLQHSMAWRPVRSMIAAHIMTNSRNEIGFYEKNGQQFASFKLENILRVANLKWSADGNMLLVHQQDPKQRNTINLYTTNNGIWSHKQCLRFEDKKILSTEFLDTEENLQKIRVNLCSETLIYSFKAIITTNSEGVCAVIAGRKLQVFNFAETVQPLPCSYSDIEIANPINFAIFNKAGNNIVAIDSKYGVHLFVLADKILRRREFSISDDDSFYPLSINQFFWKDVNEICCNFTTKELTTAAGFFNFDEVVINIKQDSAEASQVSAFCQNSDHVVIQSNGSTVLFTNGEGSLVLYDESELAINIAAYDIDGCVFVFTRTAKNTFFINNVLVATNINSFLFHYNYILFSGSNGKLFAIPLDKNELGMICQNRDIGRCYFRDIEQGSFLISGIKNSTKIILQMLRGNFEVVRFHLVGVVLVENLLQQQKWKEAADLIRLDKLSSDILIDLDYNRFFNNIDKFVTSINSAKVLNSILLELQNVNVLKNTYGISNVRKIHEIEDKKKTVCDAIANYVKITDCTNYIGTIMVCYYLKEDFSSAFQCIFEFITLRQFNLAKEAINVLLLYVDKVNLFNLSLETFNVRLIEFVAKNSQMDPLQYDHVLKRIQHAKYELKNNNEVLFLINDHLERPNLAIYNLMLERDAKKERILEYVQQHNLYKEAYVHYCVLIKENMFLEEYKMISAQYGEYLRSKRHYEESGIVFAKADLFEEAFKSYKMALNWRNAFYMLRKCNYPHQKLIKEYELMANELMNVNRVQEACEIYAEYCKLFDKAIGFLIANSLNEDAVYLAKKHNNTDALDNVIYPTIVEYAKRLFHSLRTIDENMKSYVNRLKIVRELKVLEAQKREAHDLQDYSDIVSESETTTMSTYSKNTNKSNLTTASVKYRRKQEMRKQDLKEGGVYEDIALIRIIHKSVSEVISMTKDVQTTCALLLEIRTDFTELADTLQNFTLRLYKIMPKYCSEVWPNYLFEVESNNEQEVLLRANFSELEEQYQKAPIVPDTHSWVNFLLSD